MMLFPSEGTLKALANLEGSEDFKLILAWLTDALNDRLAENSETLEEVRLRWGQGKAQVLSEILKTADNAKNLLNMMKR